jgi:tetratricopeptide (TPR) repeat protein
MRLTQARANGNAAKREKHHANHHHGAVDKLQRVRFVRIIAQIVEHESDARMSLNKGGNGTNLFKYRPVYLSTAVPDTSYSAFARIPPSPLMIRAGRLFLVLGTLLIAVTAPASAQAPVRTVDQWRATVDSLLGRRDRSERLIEAWRGLADAYSRAGKVDSGVAAVRQAVALAEALPDSPAKADAILAMGSHLLRANQNETALGYVQRGRDMRLALGDSLGASRTWNNTGAAHYQLGNYEQALYGFSQALLGRRREADTVGIARVLTNIGKVYQDWGQLGRAEARLNEAVAMARSTGDPAIIGYALNTLALVYVDTRQFALAYETIAQSLAAYTSGAPRLSSVDSLGGWRLNAAARGEALVRQGRAREALPVLDSLAAMGKENGNIRSQARALLLMGQGHAQLGQLEEARARLLESLELSRSVEQRVFMLQALEALSSVEERDGNAAASLRALRAATAMRDTIFNRSTAERLTAEEDREERERQREENAKLREAQQAQAAVIERQRVTGLLGLAVFLLVAIMVYQLVRFNRLGRAREEALAATNTQLRAALNDVRTLTGLIPICANCKRVRDDQGYWQAVESYISNHSDATFSHAICQSCGPTLYGELWPEQTEPT